MPLSRLEYWRASEGAASAVGGTAGVTAGVLVAEVARGDAGAAAGVAPAPVAPGTQLASTQATQTSMPRREGWLLEEAHGDA